MVLGRFKGVPGQVWHRWFGAWLGPGVWPGPGVWLRALAFKVRYVPYSPFWGAAARNKPQIVGYLLLEGRFYPRLDVSGLG